MSNIKKGRLNTMVFIALMTALICVIAPFSLPIPFSPIPLSLTTFILYLTLYILGPKYALISCLLYLLIGTVGVPVFSGFHSGIGALFGPTGGYLLGYLFIPLLGGLFINQKRQGLLSGFTGLLLGTAGCYLCGTLWLALQTGLSFPAALASGVLPFLPGDLCKLVFALLLGPQICKRLRKANVILFHS